MFCKIVDGFVAALIVAGSIAMNLIHYAAILIIVFFKVLWRH